MIRVLTSLVTQHHPATVLLASLVCAIAADTSFRSYALGRKPMGLAGRGHSRVADWRKSVCRSVV